MNSNHTLIWNGQPYLPFGLHIEGTSAAVAAAKLAGVQDVVVDLPASGKGWTEVLAALNAAKMRYLIRVSSLAPMTRGVAVEPQGYRVDGITRDKTVHVHLPGAESAMALLAQKRDGTVVASERIPVVNDELTYAAKPPIGVECVLLVYPVTTSLENVDAWETMDQHRDSLLASLKQHDLGAGLRGIVNVTGQTTDSPERELRFVPTDSSFRGEFRNLLEQRYRSMETVWRSWALSSSGLTTYEAKSEADVDHKPLATFEDLARLVPLWSGTRGVGLLWDPTSNKLYPCDKAHCVIWHDIGDVVTAAAQRRLTRLIGAIRSVANVPIIEEWTGWLSIYETPQPVIDGIGMRSYGTTPSALAATGCRAASSILRWKKSGWLVATDVDPGTGAEAATQLPGVADDLCSLGARGIFVRAYSPRLVQSVSSESVKRASDTTLAKNSVSAVFYPENATAPAEPQRLPGGKWWLPCPADGNRIDLGTRFFGYRMSDGNGDVFAIWTTTPGRMKLLMSKTAGVTFRATNGSDPDPKTVKGGIEVALSESPLLIQNTTEVPVPDYALMETTSRFTQLAKLAENTHIDATEQVVGFTDALKSVGANPGGSFNTMRLQLRSISNLFAPYTWLEAEKPTQTNFSEAKDLPGCSGGMVLTLRTTIAPGPDGYFAEYSVLVRSDREQEVWIAARIPSDLRSQVHISVGGQILTLSGDPASLYANGFGWYKLGTTRLAAGTSNVRVIVNPTDSADLAIDAILLTPVPFHPAGVAPPDAIGFAPPIAPKKKR